MLKLMQIPILKPLKFVSVLTSQLNIKNNVQIKSCTFAILAFTPCKTRTTHTNTLTVKKLVIPVSTVHIVHHNHHLLSKGLWGKRNGRARRRRGEEKSWVVIVYKCCLLLSMPMCACVCVCVPIWGQFPDWGSCDGSLPFRCNYFKRDWAVKHLKNITEAQWVFMLSILSSRSLQGDSVLQVVMQLITFDLFITEQQTVRLTKQHAVCLHETWRLHSTTRPL